MQSEAEGPPREREHQRCLIWEARGRELTVAGHVGFTNWLGGKCIDGDGRTSSGSSGDGNRGDDGEEGGEDNLDDLSAELVYVNLDKCRSDRQREHVVMSWSL